MKMCLVAGNLFLSWEANNISKRSMRRSWNVTKNGPAAYLIVIFLGRWPRQQKVLALKCSAQSQSNLDTIG